MNKTVRACIASLLVASAAGCSSVFQHPAPCTDLGDGKCWIVDAGYQATESTAIIWKHVTADEVGDPTSFVLRQCGFRGAIPGADAYACRWLASASECVILSNVSAQRAASVPADYGRRMVSSLSLYAHEVCHCRCAGATWIHVDPRSLG